MTATLWISLVLGLGGSLGTAFTVYTKIKDRGLEQEKRTGEVKLDKASYDKIAAEAARINSEKQIEQERWWKDQFEAVKVQNKEMRDELDEEGKFRRRITRYIRNHEPWDELAEAKLARANELHPGEFEMPPRPTLEYNAGDE